jgi:peptidylprolyl isomerase
MNELQIDGSVRMMRRMAAVVLGASLLLAGCSSAGGATAASPTPSTSGFTYKSVSVSGPFGEKPVLLIGDDLQGLLPFMGNNGVPDLVVRDVIVGNGPTASATSHVSVNYIGRTAKTKHTFDSSWARGKTFDYVPNQLKFAAFKDGVVGMKVGGRRLVVVPATLGFGDNPPPNSGVRPGETLVFVIDLQSVS